MATKTFAIEINGVSQSVSAVDALLAKLDALDDKINSLSDVDTSDLKIAWKVLEKSLKPMPIIGKIFQIELKM